MKIHFPLFFISLFFLLPCHSQSTKYITLQNSSYVGHEKLGFREFSVIDARQDTSKIGYIPYDQYAFKVSCKNGLAAEMNTFLNNYYKNVFSDTGYSIIVVIRNLWISQVDTTMHIGNDRIGSGKLAIEKLKIEFYLRKGDDYYPALRVDSFFITTQRNTRKGYGGEIEDGITSCCDRLFSINIPRILQKKKLTFTQVNEYGRHFLSSPILHTTEYKKGVYMAFQDFLQNEPSATYKSVDKKKYGDVLYLQGDEGTDYPSNKCWGYSDGKNIYITSGRNFFKLERVQNTFEFFGIKNLTENFGYRSITADASMEVIKKKKPYLSMYYYQVDMETGGSY